MNTKMQTVTKQQLSAALSKARLVSPSIFEHMHPDLAEYLRLEYLFRTQGRCAQDKLRKAWEIWGCD